MRNSYLVLLFGIIILPGCKTKSNVRGDNNANSSGSWSKQYRNNFIQDCIDKASENISASQAFKDCNCMTEKVEAKYPNETNVDEKLSNEEIQAMKTECLNSSTTQTNKSDQSNKSAGWSIYDQQEFIDNCMPTVNKTLGTRGANDYCDCMLKKLIQDYPDSKNVDKASKTYLNAIASDCLRR